MSWIQENKFTAGVAGVTLAGSVALIVMAMGKGDDYAAAKKSLKKALAEEKELQSIVPFPNEENLESLEQNVVDFEKSSNRLQRQFMAYKPKPAEVEDFAPDQFSKKVSGYRNRLDKAFRSKGVELPEGSVYGFEAYSRRFPLQVATGELSYQMQALEWLLGSLASTEPEALLNVVRPSIAVEKKVAAKKAKKKKKGAELNVDEKIYDSYPLELSFRGDEKQLTAFLEAMANSKKYYFAINTMRVQNERQTPPNASDAKFPEPPAPSSSGFDAFGEFDSGFAEEGEAEEMDVVVEEVEEPVASASTLPEVASDADEERLLMPILGDEKVNVYINLDLIVLKQGSGAVLEEKKRASLEDESNEA
jgi:hypothetical protein